MKHLLLVSVLGWLTLLTACEKENLSPITNDPGTNDPGTNNPPQYHMVKVKAVIQINDIVYDSIPATLKITSWDSSDVAHQEQIFLAAGANTINLPRSAASYKLSLSAWGITDEVTFMRSEKPEGSLITLGGSRVAKKLSRLETSVLVSGTYRPESKTIYHYNMDGSIEQIDYYQKKPQQSELMKYYTDLFIYDGSLVKKIDRLDENNQPVGSTSFTYNAQGKPENIHRTIYDEETFATVSYGTVSGFNHISIDYLFSNGNMMNYSMKLKGGNLVEDLANSSTGAGEHGTYNYDHNINPFAFMNIPDLFLSNLSINNRKGQQKTYSGSIPSAEPYQFDYHYDGEGYPTQVLTGYKSYQSGEHLYTTKTIYTYL